MGQMLQESGNYRRMWQSDSEAFRTHLLRLPAESLHNRFGMTVADDFLERYTARSIGVENIVYGYFDSQKTLRAVGELRPVNPHRLLGIGGEMEGAFSVESCWCKRGIGSELMRLIIRAARSRCCSTLYLSFLTGNLPMRKLALKYGAEIQADHSESFGLTHPGLPTSASMIEESSNDVQSFAIAALNLQRQRFQKQL